MYFDALDCVMTEAGMRVMGMMKRIAQMMSWMVKKMLISQPLHLACRNCGIRNEGVAKILSEAISPALYLKLDPFDSFTVLFLIYCNFVPLTIFSEMTFHL